MSSRVLASLICAVAASTASAQPTEPSPAAPSPAAPPPAAPPPAEPPPAEPPPAEPPAEPPAAPPSPPTEPIVPPGAPAPVVAAPEPARVATPPRRPWILDHGRYYAGIELGHGDMADPTNGFASTGLGRSLVFGVGRIEFRHEGYDLEMRDPSYAEAMYAKGRFTATSVGLRIGLGGTLAQARLLVGVAYLRRPSLSIDPEDILSGNLVRRHQHGLGAVVGVGVRLLRFFTVEARAYPATWTDNTGDMRIAYADGAPMTETIAESPGGLPITLTAGVGISW